MALRVLLVDDDPAILRTLRRVLKHECDVACAGDSRAAFARLARGERFSAIVCDVKLPDIDGTELFDVIAQEWPDQARRMVFITGNASKEEQASAASRGTEVLRKPCANAQILAAIGRAANQPIETIGSVSTSPRNDACAPTSTRRRRRR